MGLYLNPGNEGFKNIVNGIYRDKTGLINVINSTLNTLDKLTCISRPRRFGKSYTAKMLSAYYDRSCEDSRELFIDKKVAETDSPGGTLWEVLSADCRSLISGVQNAVILK